MAADLDALVHLEQTFYDDGYTAGFAHGRIHGLIDGRALGRQHGFALWEELGFYHGFATTWRALLFLHADQSERAPGPGQGLRSRAAAAAAAALHHIDPLLALIERFPTANPSQDGGDQDGGPDIEKLQRQIRSRYKALCASLGVRPTLRAGLGPDSAADDPEDEPVWTLERPGGLSF